MNDVIRMAALQNVLTTEETCKIIGRSRQQLNTLINNGDIEVFKRTTNGNLFWKPEVYQLLRKLNHDRKQDHHEIYGPSTFDSIEAFRNLKLNYSEIVEIFVFFSHQDAIFKGFYSVEGLEMPDTLRRVKGPRFIIVMQDGREYWFDGLTCGYTGTGCIGTEEVLSEIGVLEKEEELNPMIAYYPILHCRREGDSWNIDGEESTYYGNSNDGSDLYSNMGIDEIFYIYNDTLVLVQNACHRSVAGEIVEPALDVLSKSLRFVSNPVSLEILPYDKAVKTGHYSCVNDEVIVYQIVIKDLLGRELWLDYPVDKLSCDKQWDLMGLFGQLGVNIEESKMSEKIMRWLKVRPRNIYRNMPFNSID